MDQKVFSVNLYTRAGNPTREDSFGNGWKIFFSIKKRVVEIRRPETSEEVYVCGVLNLKNLLYKKENQNTSEEVFSRFMKAESTSETIQFENYDYLQYSFESRFCLYGNIFIFNITQNRIKECKKCASLRVLSNDLGGMLDSSTSCFADIQLKCESESIPAHKSMLSVRSSVFAAMFKNPMKESIKNEVDINDLDATVLRSMLTYIYTGQIPDLTVSLASNLLFAADKYLLEDLKRVCRDYLKDNLSLQNVLGILVFSDLHSESELKYSAISYICNKCEKFSDLEETEKWKSIMKENTALAMEILMSVVKSRDEKIMLHRKT